MQLLIIVTLLSLIFLAHAEEETKRVRGGSLKASVSDIQLVGKKKGRELKTCTNRGCSQVHVLTETFSISCDVAWLAMY